MSAKTGRSSGEDRNWRLLTRLEFLTVDSLGHCCVCADIEAGYSSAGSDKFQRAGLLVHLDEFARTAPESQSGCAHDNEPMTNAPSRTVCWMPIWNKNREGVGFRASVADGARG